MSGNLYHRVAAEWGEQGWQSQRPFIRTSESTLNYAQADAISAQLAHVLRESGVRQGDRVLAQTEKSPTALLLYLACLRAGAIYVPLNTAYTLAELEYFIADADPVVVVCTPEKQGAITSVIGAIKSETVRVLTLSADGKTGSLQDNALRQSTAFADAILVGTDLAAILYTSGTTGRSKGAMLSHDNLASNCFALKEYWQYTSQDVLLHALPIFHTHGLFVATNVTLAAGASMILLPKFDTVSVRHWLPAATVMMGVPTFYVRLLQESWLTPHAAAHMRLFVSGSAPLLSDTHRQWHERTGHAILERYGMTETNMNTSNPYDHERVPGTVGMPLPGVQLRIADAQTHAALPSDTIGVIEVKGPNVFCGYWRMPEKTQAEFTSDGYFITGDLGKVDARGYVHIVGRGKDLIITGGFNVYPKEVETEIDALPGVEESAVIGLPHADFGEGVTAVVVLLKDTALGESEVIARLRQRLAAFKIPKRVLFVEQLPRNTMGKVQKNVLRERYAKLYE